MTTLLSHLATLHSTIITPLRPGRRRQTPAAPAALHTVVEGAEHTSLWCKSDKLRGCSQERGQLTGRGKNDESRILEALSPIATPQHAHTTCAPHGKRRNVQMSPASASNHCLLINRVGGQKETRQTMRLRRSFPASSRLCGADVAKPRLLWPELATKDKCLFGTSHPRRLQKKSSHLGLYQVTYLPSMCELSCARDHLR